MSNLDFVLHWWEMPDDEQFGSLFNLVKRIDSNDLNRREVNLRCARLYGNNIFASLSPAGYYTKYISQNVNQKKLTLSLIGNMADTVTSKMTKIKPKVMFLTSDGDYLLQQKAKKMQKFIEGQFYLSDYYNMTNKRVMDSLIFDVGVTKIAAQGDHIIVERVLPDELKTDPEDAAYGNPTHMYQLKYYRRTRLAAMFPDKKDIINTANSYFTNEYRSAFTEASQDFVVVIEGWHLDSGGGAEDGKHIIAISNGTLMTEPYTKPHFPFIFTKWVDSMIGFYGQSLADKLTPIQFEVNKILRDIQTSMNLFAIPFISCEVGSRINRSQINNQIAHIVDYVNTPPRFETPPVMSQQVFDHLERLIKQAYEITGVSQLSATSKKPSGLDAAVALREYQDIESERFLHYSSKVEQSYIDSAKLFIDAAKDVAAVNPDYKVKVPGKKFLETIKWNEIDLEDEAYDLKLYPASMLPESPAGRLQFVMEMQNTGLITKEEALSMLEFPDLDAYTSLITAATEDIMHTISYMLTEKEYLPPEATQDLANGIKRVNAAYLKAKNNGVEESVLELLRQWIEDATTLMTPPAAPTPPAPTRMLPEAPEVAPTDLAALPPNLPPVPGV